MFPLSQVSAFMRSRGGAPSSGGGHQGALVYTMTSALSGPAICFRRLDLCWCSLNCRSRPSVLVQAHFAALELPLP